VTLDTIVSIIRKAGASFSVCFVPTNRGGNYRFTLASNVVITAAQYQVLVERLKAKTIAPTDLIASESDAGRRNRNRARARANEADR